VFSIVLSQIIDLLCEEEKTFVTCIILHFLNVLLMDWIFLLQLQALLA